jgi:hypothetical protein
VKPQAMQLVFVASSVRTQYWDVRTKNGWLGVTKINVREKFRQFRETGNIDYTIYKTKTIKTNMYPSGVTCLSVD